jgi:hypothetical protein
VPASDCGILEFRDVDPRLSFVYRLNDKTIFRAGFNIFHHLAAVGSIPTRPDNFGFSSPSMLGN